jgi:putative glycosyltransferase (TIGR04372 family)
VVDGGGLVGYKKVSIIEVFLNKKEYLCVAPIERSFGNPAEDIFYGLMVAKMKGRKLVIISRKQTFLRRILSRFIKDWMTNKEIFDLECPGVIVPRYNIAGYNFFAGLLDTVYLFFTIFRMVLKKLIRFDLFYSNRYKLGHFFEMPHFGWKTIYNPDEKAVYSWESSKSYEWNKFLFEKYPVQFDAKKEMIAQEARLKIGLPLDASYVCLHVRDGGFRYEDMKLGGFRCADISNYEKAVDILNSHGLWVVRIGDPRMKPSPFKNKKFIDYAFSPYKSDLVDLYLLKNCKLFFGMDSGPYDPAILFQREMVLSNLSGWVFATPPRYGDLALVKYVYSKAMNRFLSVREMLEEPCTIDCHQFSYYHKEFFNYIWVENTVEEIQSVVKEKLNQKSNYVYSALQNEFVEKRRAQLEAWIPTHPIIKKKPSQCYRFAARGNYRGTLGEEFLRKNWEFGEHLEKMTFDFKKAGLDKQ